MTSTDTPAGTRLPAEPTDPASQLQWLVDRARIGDLLIEFARTLDEKEWDAHVGLYLPDGVFSVNNAFRLTGHEQLRRTGSPMGLGKYAATWHLSSNHAIHIDGDTAVSRSYLLGAHVLPGGDIKAHADGAGWYDCTYRRTPQGWRFATVTITEVWRAGQDLSHVNPTGPGKPPAG